MKEATGEFNSTIVVVIAVGLLMAFFYTIIWPSIKNNMDANTKCSKAYCEKCTDPGGCTRVTCHYKDSTIYCPWKG